MVGMRSIVWVSELRRSPDLFAKSGVMEEQRDVRDLVIAGHAKLGPPVVLAEQEAVVRRNQERGVLPQVAGVEVVQQPAHLSIAKGDDGAVVRAQLGAFVRSLGDPRVGRPVENRAAIVRRVVIAEAGRGEERLVRIERLDLEQPVLCRPVRVEELQTGVETPDGRKVLLRADGFAVDDVVIVETAAAVVELAHMVFLAQALPRRLHHGLPGVPLLAANELVGVVAVVIGEAPVFPVVVVVGDEVAVDALLVEQLGERVVERFQRTPATMQEVEPPGLHVTARRHARQAAGIVGVERDATFGQSAEVRCLDGPGSVRLQ